MLSKLVTPSTGMPVTLDEAKSFLRVEHSHEDSAITRFILAAASACQKEARISFLAQVWQATYTLPRQCGGVPSERAYPWRFGGAGGFGGSIALGLQGAFSNPASEIADPDNINSYVDLPYGPVRSITSLTLSGDALTPLAVDNSNYVLNGARVVWNDSFRELLGDYRTLSFVYATGFVDKATMDAQGADLQTAILMTVAMIYEHRGLSEITIPPAAKRLLNNYWDSPTY
jgi:hypothetical protein